MKRRHFVQWLVAAGLAACGKAPTLPPVGSGSSVLAFGDSVTYGTGAGRDEDWPSLLAQRTGWQIAMPAFPATPPRRRRNASRRRSTNIGRRW